MRGEAWFYVGENDVFPETFINFLAFDDRSARRSCACTARSSRPDSGATCRSG